MVYKVLRPQRYNKKMNYASKCNKNGVFCTKWWMKIWKFEKNVLSLQKI